MTETEREPVREILISGLRNAHAMERQAVATLEPQVRGLREYPEFQARVVQHVQESRVQADRLEAALRRFGTKPSGFKDVALSVMGLGQSTMQLFADDAPIKAMLTDTMFEHFEIAAYRSLLELAEITGAADLKSDLQSSLGEEEAMAAWLEANLADVTRRYVALAERPRTAKANVGRAEGGPAEMASAASGGAQGAAEAEMPRHDLEEFTDAEPERAPWPDGTEDEAIRPKAE